MVHDPMYSLHAEQIDIRSPLQNSAPEGAAEGNADGGDVWKMLERMLHDVRERRLAYLFFHCGLKPREIIHLCPQEFSDVNEVYRLRRNIFERLLGDADLMRQLLPPLSRE